MSKPKVYLTGGDNINWALDNDLLLTRRALEGLVEFTSLAKSEVVHSMWMNTIAKLSQEKLEGKKIISHIPGEPFRYLTAPDYQKKAKRVGLWIAQTYQAQGQMASIDVEALYIPYTVDTDIFRQIPQNDPGLLELKQQWDLPSDKYLIGNFHRDTEGSDLISPKLMKGPDIFLEVVRVLHQKGHPIHVVLAGPRRFWMRRRLTELNIPFTFIGSAVDNQDDIALNVLPQDQLNLLYNIIDLYIVSSRSEGGPRSLLEAAATQCKVISTPVGLALDLLETQCMFSSPNLAVRYIEEDISNQTLQVTKEPHFQRILKNHRIKTVRPLFKDIYDNLDQIPTFTLHKPKVSLFTPIAQTLKRFQVNFLPNYHHSKSSGDLRISVWQKFMKPPYGGGNQFMLAMSKALRQRGIIVEENAIAPEIDVYLLNSIHFDVDKFLQYKRKRKLNVVHRIDGPIHLIRGFDREKDDLCFQLNKKFAAASIIQSIWTYKRIIEMGYQPVNPVIVNNAVDPDIFHPKGRIPFDQNRKIRLISTSWSNNPRKGGPIYKWIEEHLDWERFDYTFVGRCSESFQRIRQVDPVPSEELADILRQHDIYITASQNDPCSNALIEALACGLPALYLNDGGHPELVGSGGLPFNGVEEILAQLDRLVEYYETFQNLITAQRMENVADIYFKLLQAAAEK
jgi:glycosyltransferase involved in cell wall biosynthesis